MIHLFVLAGVVVLLYTALPILVGLAVVAGCCGFIAMLLGGMSC